MSTKRSLILQQRIENKIFIIRGKKVMLDRDLAELYGVSTKQLNQQVKRNIKRFPDDFMLQLSEEEMKFLRSQFVTLEKGKYSKYEARAFTEQGVAMLSGVLNSDRAIAVNIQIMRAFTKLRELMSTHRDLKIKIEAMEKKYDKNFEIVFRAIKRLLEPSIKPKDWIG